ncbi:MAG: Rpn family recombination-promoting nuclease/putative transposase [Bacteroidales bacterium]|nr:Rpn family recombination-promoting nuclease/putative transposase [Lachnoclostridium sp.]MCM1466316.1 Rpn family recombination-promoting nuclease/putative transposase [Bacteroidales bacterium]
MNTELKNAVSAADEDARYDDKAKRLLGNKIILAHILVKTVDEFKGMHPEDVVSYIEGEPFISVVPVEPGLTNAEKDKSGQRIVGMNTENAEINEGLIRFDIVFYVRIPSTDGISQVIVNVEAQKDEPAGYHILNRAVFYVSRLVSSQKERDFVKTNYDDIKRVFSIWVCMNMDENSMDYVHLTDDKLIGSYPWKGGLDLLNIVLIGIANELPAHSNEYEHDDKYELHRLLSTLFSMELTASEKLGIIENEYSIPLDDKIREDVSEMCNLSQGIREKGGTEREEKIILNMHKKGYTSEQIAEIVEKSVREVEAVIQKREPVLA